MGKRSMCHSPDRGHNHINSVPCNAPCETVNTWSKVCRHLDNPAICGTRCWNLLVCGLWLEPGCRGFLPFRHQSVSGVQRWCWGGSVSFVSWWISTGPNTDCVHTAGSTLVSDATEMVMKVCLRWNRFHWMQHVCSSYTVLHSYSTLLREHERETHWGASGPYSDWKTSPMLRQTSSLWFVGRHDLLWWKLRSLCWSVRHHRPSVAFDSAVPSGGRSGC